MGFSNIFSDILSELVHVGRNTKPGFEQQAGFVLANNTAAFLRDVRQLLKICVAMFSICMSKPADTTWKVLSYIERNFSKYELSLEKIASDLNMGINRVSQIIKGEPVKVIKIILLTCELIMLKSYC